MTSKNTWSSESKNARQSSLPTNTQLRREIEGQRLAEEQLLRRNRELLSLQTAIAATAASLDVQFVLDTVTWEMANLLEVDHCIIYEWKPQANSPVSGSPASIIGPLARCPAADRQLG